jgi:N-acetylmuramoyl-L-alanine amidase
VKTQDLGGKQSRFFVLRNTLVPAVLVEMGFLSNPREERLLKSSEYRQKIAEGLAKGILGYDGR